MKARMTSKMIKRTAAIGAAAVMAMASVPMISVFATSMDPRPNETTSPANVTYTFKAYELFTTTNNMDFTFADDNVKAILDAADSTLFAGCTTATEYAAAIGGLDQTGADAFAKKLAIAIDEAETKPTSKNVTVENDKANVNSATALSYYIITGTAANGTATADTMGMLIQANESGVAETKVKPKVDLPTVEKKVYEDSGIGNWQDVADADVGQEVQFMLTATLPSNLDMYNSYFIQFNDYLDQPGFDEADSFKNVKVYLNEVSEDNELATSPTEVTIDEVTNKIGKGFRYDNVKDLQKSDGTKVKAGDKIILTYTATLTDGAVTTPTMGNDNAVTLVYPNNPNHEYTSTGEGSDGPDNPNTPKGETPKDEVRVLTYGTVIDKISSVNGDDSNPVKLAGAKFTLTNSDGQYAQFDDNYNFTGWGVAESTITSTVDGVTIKGLDEGEYTLTETEAPEGYNLPATASQTITITRTFVDDVNNIDFANAPTTNPIQTLEFTTNSAYSEFDNKDVLTTGMADLIVKNTPKDTITLPETGGMGTRIFFTAGGALAVGGAIYLVSKKRSKEEE